jgi:hypothetical protein
MPEFAVPPGYRRQQPVRRPTHSPHCARTRIPGDHWALQILLTHWRRRCSARSLRKKVAARRIKRSTANKPTLPLTKDYRSRIVLVNRVNENQGKRPVCPRVSVPGFPVCPRVSCPRVSQNWLTGLPICIRKQRNPLKRSAIGRDLATCPE